MIEKGYYIGKERKLLTKFGKTLSKFQTKLTEQLGEDFTKLIIKDATKYFIELIPRIPYYNTAVYLLFSSIDSSSKSNEDTRKND